MSYILDALKKSEQERGHGSIPGVQTVHSSSLNYSNKKTYWPYILIAAVLLNLATILYFVFDKANPSENITITEANTIENNTELLTSTNNTQTAITAEPHKQPVDSTSITESKSAEKISSASTASKTSTGTQLATTPVTDNITKNNSSQITAKADRNSSENNTDIIEFDDLPESIKQQLPTIMISAHVYSTNPLQRSIVINNNFMEEGEYFMDDLILHEITADGAIFYYRDTKFHLDVVSGWQ